MSKKIDLPSDLLQLEVYTYGNLETINETLSKCRVRIFYKGMNRNRTYISDDFAAQLINSLPYTPIKGIFDYAEGDYTDHGEDNSDGRIYGIIPENPNFAWEKHLDKDGVEREYATADVYVFTAIYPEAAIITDKPQSMEIYKNNLQAEWRISELDGKPYLFFISGCLLGLQILGDNVEPCFQGAAFYSYQKFQQDLQACVNYIQKIQSNEKKEGDKMDKSVFILSDNEKAELIFNALNPNFNEDGNWEVNYYLMDVYDDYAICAANKKREFARVNYTKTENSITLGEITPVFMVYVTETEYSALQAIQAVNGTYENANNKMTELETQNTEFNSTIEELKNEKADFEAKISTLESEKTEFENKIQDFETQISEKDTQIENFTSKIDELTSEKAVLESEKNDIIKEKNSLETFKLNVETKEKESILTEFSAHLTEEMIENFNQKISEYSVEDFKKEVCTCAYETDKSMFSHKDSELIYTGSNDGSVLDSGAIRILKKYKNNGGNE